jgi:hypothetical protein
MNQQLLSYGMDSLPQTLRYDSVWTSLALDPELASQTPFETIDVAQGFRNALNSAPHAAQDIADALEGDARFAEMRESLREVLSTDEYGRLALAALAEQESLAGLARAGAKDIRDSTSEALLALERDLTSLLSGKPAEGYLFDSFLCGAARLSMAAGLATVWIPPHAQAIPAVSLGAAVYKTAKCGKKGKG